jgi:hypothetical protein
LVDIERGRDHGVMVARRRRAERVVAGVCADVVVVILAPACLVCHDTTKIIN